MSYARTTAASVARSLGVFMILGLCLLTAWLCLIAGAVLYLGPIVGQGAALLVTGGALVVMAALIVLIFRTAQPRPQAPAADDQRLRLITTILGLGPRQAGALVLLASLVAGGLGALMIVKGGPAARHQKPPNR